MKTKITSSFSFAKNYTQVNSKTRNHARRIKTKKVKQGVPKSRIKELGYQMMIYKDINGKAHFIGVKPLHNMANKNVNLALDSGVITPNGSGAIYHTSLTKENENIRRLGTKYGWKAQIDNRNKHQKKRSRKVSFQDKMLYGVSFRTFKRRLKKYRAKHKKYVKKMKKWVAKGKKGKKPKKVSLYGTTPLKNGLIEFGNAQTVPKIYAAIKKANPNSNKHELAERTYHSLNQAMKSTINHWNHSYLGKAMPIVSYTTNFDENKKHTGALHAHVTLLMCGKSKNGKLSCDKNKAIQQVVRHELGYKVSNRRALSLMKNNVTDPLINHCFGSELRRQFPEVPEFKKFRLVRDPLDNYNFSNMAQLKKYFKDNSKSISKQKSLIHKQLLEEHSHQRSISKYKYRNNSLEAKNKHLNDKSIAMKIGVDDEVLDNSLAQSQSASTSAKEAISSIWDYAHSLANRKVTSLADSYKTSYSVSGSEMGMTMVSSAKSNLSSSNSSVSTASLSVAIDSGSFAQYYNVKSSEAEKLSAKNKLLTDRVRTEVKLVNQLLDEARQLKNYKNNLKEAKDQLASDKSIGGAISLILKHSKDYQPNEDNQSKMNQIKSVAYYYFHPDERNKQISRYEDSTNEAGNKVQRLNKQAKNEIHHINKVDKHLHHFEPQHQNKSESIANSEELQNEINNMGKSSLTPEQKLKLGKRGQGFDR